MNVQLIALELVSLTVEQLPLVVKQHIQSILPTLLKLSHANLDSSTIQVRIAALDCLGRLPGALQSQVLMPYANMVIKELASVLDDRKRLVRIAAVDCRTTW